MVDPRPQRLVQDHQALVWRSLRRLGVPDADLDDAMQEVFLNATKHIAEITSPRGYLLRACLFAASRARRTIWRRREVYDAETLCSQVDPRETPEQAIEHSEDRRLLQDVLDAIPEQFRIVFILFELERFTTAEIAEYLELPVGTVASRLRRARELFLQTVARIGAQGSRT